MVGAAVGCSQVAVVVGGIFSTPLIDRYTHLWAYLQEITGYLSVPFAVVGLSGIFLPRVNRQGALVAVGTGIALSVFLLADSHADGGLLGILRHPYLNSFLHRSFLCAVVTFIALLTTSLLTAKPSAEVLAGTFSFAWVQGEGETAKDLRQAGFWMAGLFVIVSALWWVFR